MVRVWVSLALLPVLKTLFLLLDFFILLHILPTLIGESVPSLIASYYGMLSWYQWEACSFLKGHTGAVNLGMGRTSGRSGGKGGQGWNALYEKNKFKKIILL